MSRDRSSPSRPIRSDSDRPSRHTDHAATMSNSRRGDTLEQGHPAQAALSRPLAPLMPSSEREDRHDTSQAARRSRGGAVAGSRRAGRDHWSRPGQAGRRVWTLL